MGMRNNKIIRQLAAPLALATLRELRMLRAHVWNSPKLLASRGKALLRDPRRVERVRP